MRNRDARDRKRHQARVEGGAAIVGGKKPERNADKNREDHRRKGKRERVRQALQNQAEHGLLAPDRRAEIAVQEADDEADVLLGNRAVEAERSADLVELLGRGALTLRVHDAHRVAGPRWIRSVTAIVVTKIVSRPMARRLRMKAHTVQLCR